MFSPQRSILGMVDHFPSLLIHSSYCGQTWLSISYCAILRSGSTSLYNSNCRGVMECLPWDLFLEHVYDSVGSRTTVGWSEMRYIF